MTDPRNELRVYVVETEHRSRWFVWGVDHDRGRAWDIMRTARENHPREKFRTRVYRPSLRKGEFRP